VVDESPRHRLAAVAALSPRFDATPLPHGEDPLRVARARRPDLVLLALQRGAPDDGLRLCRTLRTDVRPIERVGVYVRGRPPRSVDQVCDVWRADGYLAGECDGVAIVAFAEALLRGERPVTLPEPAEGTFERLVGRFRRVTGRG
jgi:CheY-like chemotaxis protein